MNPRLMIKLRSIAVNKFEIHDWEYISNALSMEPSIDIKVPDLFRKLYWNDVNEARVLAARAFNEVIAHGDNGLKVFLEYVQAAYPQEYAETGAEVSETHILKNRWLGNLSHAIKNDGLISLMTPFDARFEPVNAVLQSVCLEVGFKLEHVANNPKSEIIIHKIAELMYTSRLVVFNITDLNPNVMYELGLAHAMNKEIQIISEQVSDIPFDFRHIGVLRYLPNEQGLMDLGVKFRAALKR